MVRIPCAKMVILSLGLLQMGPISSVLAAPASAALEQNRKEIEFVSSAGSITQRQPSCQMYHCPLHAKVHDVQKRMDSGLGFSNVLKYSVEAEKLIERICLAGQQAQSKQSGTKTIFPSLMSMDPESFRLMAEIVVESAKKYYPQRTNDRVATRVEQYKENPDDEQAKKGIVWWLDRLLFGSAYADAAKYDYKTYGTDMYEDYQSSLLKIKSEKKVEKEVVKGSEGEEN
ncbi:hypothetical protein C8R42DRAFT_725068 [Lentinula raphanica]|nr:hypothetical protein C8R42DRAFT_725068 [Lentinula raphanica]